MCLPHVWNFGSANYRAFRSQLILPPSAAQIARDVSRSLTSQVNDSLRHISSMANRDLDLLTGSSSAASPSLLLNKLQTNAVHLFMNPMRHNGMELMIVSIIIISMDWMQLAFFLFWWWCLTFESTTSISKKNNNNETKTDSHNNKIILWWFYYKKRKNSRVLASAKVQRRKYNIIEISSSVLCTDKSGRCENIEFHIIIISTVLIINVYLYLHEIFHDAKKPFNKNHPSY